MAKPGPRLDPVTRYVRGLRERDYLTGREAATLLGISREQLMSLARNDPQHLGPGYVTWMGEVKIYLYTQPDLDQINAYLAEQAKQARPLGRDRRYLGGRPLLWTNVEHASRHRRRALARYHHLAGQRFAEQGRTERAARSAARSAQLTADLAAELAARKAQLSPAPAAYVGGAGPAT